MQRDVIPGMRKDPDYLRKKGFRQVDGRVVQPPGPNNALGRVKINFPNPHLVYLHDTPQRDLFNEDARAFSSGCIRVERIVELASLVLNDPERWPASAIRTAIDSGSTQFIEVERTLPVLLLYWTAVAGVGDEEVYFYDDVYKRDGAELAALDGPFTFDQRAVTAARHRSRP
jgi:murein L,D-transpeptidase YcbB/YkuD